LLDFARVCDVRDVRSRVEKLLLAAERVMQRETEIVESIPHIADAIGHGADLFKKTFCP
jgi:hypothetical protein